MSNSRVAMASSGIVAEERIGLGVAIAAHVGLVALLVWRPPSPPLIPPPERMTVTLSDNIGLTSTSPEPMAKAAPDLAPTVGEAPLPEPEPLPAPQPREIPSPAPRPAPRPVTKTEPTPAKAKPTSPAKAQPAKAKPTSPAKPQPAKAERSERKAPAGASQFADAFKEGVPGGQSVGKSRNAPAATIGPAVQSSLASAISRQLKPHWTPPQGADADKLITVLAWNLNADGSLAGTPRVVSQSGITDANRPQAQRHAELAIRSVQLAAPFDLPEEYYSGWRRVSQFRFDWKLSQ